MKRMNVLACSLGVILALVAAPCLPARRPPKVVAPVVRDGIQYTAPHERMGCVEARPVGPEGPGEPYWRRQIYVVKYGPLSPDKVAVERDGQDCYVTKLEFSDGKLVVTNEREFTYELDLKTLEVKVLTGTLVVCRD